MESTKKSRMDKHIKKRETKAKKEKKEKKIKVIKAKKLQTAFCILSSLFIVACCIFYGTRLVKFYKVYNPKSESGEVLMTLSSSIISNSSIVYEGDGLYINQGNYVYKGSDVNNYLLFSDMLFRIVKINNDKTIEIVLDEYVNKMEFDLESNNILESNVLNYLNDNFLKHLNKDMLTTSNICKDTINNINSITCLEIDNSSYIKLLSLSDFLNSFNEENSYLVKGNEYVWLYNAFSDGVWHTKGINVSHSDSNSLFGVKPVITLKNSTILEKGNGSLNNPYQIAEGNINNQIHVGTYLDINDDVYIVYEIGEDYYKLQSNKVLPDIMMFDKKTNIYKDSSLREYLENDYLSSLSYKNLLKEVTWDNFTSKVGLLTRKDLKFNSSLENYYLLDMKDDELYLYNGSLISSEVSAKRNIRPCIAISKDFNIISGNGSLVAPYIVEE